MKKHHRNLNIPEEKSTVINGTLNILIFNKVYLTTINQNIIFKPLSRLSSRIVWGRERFVCFLFS